MGQINKLCEGKKTFKDEQHLKAWLLRVTINRCNDLLKSAWYQRCRPIENIPEPTLPEKPEYDDLDEALSRLSGKQRVVIHLHYFEGYSTDEIATITDENPATVRSLLYRARQSLRIEIGARHE